MEKDFGVQPLDNIMTSLALSNADLVLASKEQLTFKMVQKGRKGRKLTPNMQNKILRALQRACPDNHFSLKDVFNYGNKVEQK